MKIHYDDLWDTRFTIADSPEGLIIDIPNRGDELLLNRRKARAIGKHLLRFAATGRLTRRGEK